jgi:hypothetical protein
MAGSSSAKTRFALLPGHDEDAGRAQITRHRPARQTNPRGQTRPRGTTTTGAGATTIRGTTTRGATTTAPPFGRHPP